MTTEADDETPTAASPYSTGGGGTVLEHRYGAVLLAHLLTGDPVTELGDDLAPVRVAFQASAFSPVDDLVVSGRSTDGSERRVSIGVRRNPSLVPSDEPSVQLLASYLRVVSDHWSDVQAGRWRLALAVASPNAAVRQVAALAEIARDVPNEATFRGEVARPGRTNQATRQRLPHLDAVVAATAAHAGIDTSALPAGELTWRLLSALRVRELRLEGVDETDRTVTVGRLREVSRDGTSAAADALLAASPNSQVATPRPGRSRRRRPYAATLPGRRLAARRRGRRRGRSSTGWPGGFATGPAPALAPPMVTLSWTGSRPGERWPPGSPRQPSVGEPWSSSASRTSGSPRSPCARPRSCRRRASP